jgi:hypothetical protein
MALAVAISSTWAAAADSGTASEIELLKQEVNALKARLRQLEARPQVSEQNLEVAVSGSERSASAEAAASATAEAKRLELGGALRFNLLHRDYAEASKGRRGEGGLDVFRLNLDGQLDNILVSAEYRFYSYMSVLHHGWIGYQFDDDSQLQFGVSQVPFGLLPYPAHNSWFGVPYYVGLGDDYDMGIKYQRSDGPWSTHLAFYKNAELNDAGNTERYSFDVIRQGEQQNEETNQLNARAAYTFGLGSTCQSTVGTSLQAGELYNATIERRGDHWAVAAHLDSRCGRWNFQAQASRYQYNPANPEGQDNSAITMGAFAGSYPVAADADMAVANIAYNVPSPWQSIDSITCYNDYSHLFKHRADAHDSMINTTGCAIGSGPLFTYIDYIMANNMAYFANGSMAGGGEDKWHGRFNVNIGFYW